jgi:hypothetical protein
MWTKSDQRFLRSLRIESTNPPVPLPRFRVEPSDVEGGYRVIDTLNQVIASKRLIYRTVYEVDETGVAGFSDPRDAAENIAAQLNVKHGAEQP